MSHEPIVARRQVEITNALGLHLRPATKFVQTADRFQAEVHVWYKGQSYDGQSILDLAGLAAERGARLDLEAIGPDAEAAINALAELIAADFYEDEFGDPRAPGPGGPRPDPETPPPPDPPADASPSTCRSSQSDPRNPSP